MRCGRCDCGSLRCLAQTTRRVAPQTKLITCDIAIRSLYCVVANPTHPSTKQFPATQNISRSSLCVMSLLYRRPFRVLAFPTRQELYCSSLQCPDRSTPIDDASVTECAGDTCEASQCCEAKCSYYQCPDRSTPVEDADDIVCPDLECSDELCCEAKCSYHQCPTGETLVEDADEIVCEDQTCTDDLCCEVRESLVVFSERFPAAVAHDFFIAQPPSLFPPRLLSSAFPFSPHPPHNLCLPHPPPTPLLDPPSFSSPSPPPNPFPSNPLLTPLPSSSRVAKSERFGMRPRRRPQE